MPTINLQTILNGEDIGTMISKINENFAQIAAIGGGPQGSRGIQGPPGLPGLRGDQGNAGDNGIAGKQVTIVGDDPNWGTLYSGSPSTTTDATSAIAEGYNVGDIWIDNNAGVFYDIHEPSAGVYEFQPHPLSPAVTSASTYWIPDSAYSTNTNPEDANEQGLLMANRLATLSLTSYVNTLGSSLPGDAALSSQIINQYEFGYVGGYRRPSYKLSIDQVIPTVGGPGQIGRVDGDNASSSLSDSNLLVPEIEDSLLFGARKDEFAPLMYLNTSTGTVNSLETSSTAFGFLHSVRTTSLETYAVLSLKGGADTLEDRSIFNIDVPYISSPAKHVIFNNNQNDINNLHVLGVSDINPDGSVNANARYLWLSLTSQPDGTLQPFDTNETFNTMGIRLGARTNGDGEIDFYTHNRQDNASSKKYLPGAANDLHMQIREGNTWVTKSLNVGQNFGSSTTHPYIPNGAMIEGHLTVGRTTGTLRGQPFPIDTFPYSFRNTYPGIAPGETPFTIEQSNKKFVFRNSDGPSVYTMFFTIDEESASIRTNVQTQALTFGVEWWQSPTYFKGNDLIIQPNGNVGLGYNPDEDVNSVNAKFNNRFVITAHGADSPDGLEDHAGIQITNPTRGYGKNQGAILRLGYGMDYLQIANATGNASTGIGWYSKSVSDTNISTGRRMHLSSAGALSLGGINNDLGWVAPGDSTLGVGGIHMGSSDVNRDALYMGNMNRQTIGNLEARTPGFSGLFGSSWIGFNAWVNDSDNPSSPSQVTFGNKPFADTTVDGENSAGVIQFMDQEGKFHIAARQRGYDKFQYDDYYKGKLKELEEAEKYAAEKFSGDFTPANVSNPLEAYNTQFSKSSFE